MAISGHKWLQLADTSSFTIVVCTYVQLRRWCQVTTKVVKTFAVSAKNAATTSPGFEDFQATCSGGEAGTVDTVETLEAVDVLDPAVSLFRSLFGSFSCVEGDQGCRRRVKRG